MSTFADFLSTHDNAMQVFCDNAADNGTKYLAASASVLKDGVNDANLKEYDVARLDLARQLEAAGLSILRLVPKQENEDNFGTEVQANVAGTLSGYAAKLRGSGKPEEAGVITSHKAFLAALAALHKENKDRPDTYPKDLDERQLAATTASFTTLVSDSYLFMTRVVAHTVTLLEKNRKLVQEPKRAYGGYM